MGVSRGIAGFMDGFVQGANQRQAWADAKRRRTIEDEEMQWRREDRDIAADERERRRKIEDENLDWQRKERGYLSTVRGLDIDNRKRVAAQEESDRAMLADAYDDAKDAEKSEEQKAAEDREAQRTAEAKKAVPLDVTMQGPQATILPGSSLETAAKAAGLGTVPGAAPPPTVAKATVPPAPEPSAPAPAPVAARGLSSLIASPANAAEMDPNARPGIDPAPAPAPAPASTPTTRESLRADRAVAAAPVYEARAARTAARTPAAAVKDARATGQTPPVAAEAANPALKDPAYPRPQAIEAAPAVPARGLSPSALNTPVTPAAPAVTSDASPALAAAASPAAPVLGSAPDAAPDRTTMVGADAAARLDPAYPRPQAIEAAPAVPARGGNPVPPAAPTNAPAPVATADASPAPSMNRARRPEPPASGDTAPRVMVPSDAPAAPAAVTPSIAIADETVGPRISRARGLEETAPAIRTARARDFLSIYAEKAVPQIMEHYLKTGRVKEAQAWQEWAQSEKTREGMESWAKMIHAAKIGDEEGFFENAIDTYNATGYFDDGYEAIASGSSLTRDSKGNITGATLKLRNQATGKTFEQKFEDVDDLYNMGIYLLSPEKVFERGMAELDAAKSFEAEQAQDDLKQQRAIELEVVKKSLDGGGNADVKSAYDDLSKEDVYGTGFNAMSEEQKAAAVAARIAQMKRLSGATSLGTVNAGGRGAAAPVDW